MSRLVSPATAGAYAGSTRANVCDHAAFIYEQRAKGVSVQHIARQIGKASEDVHRFLNPVPVPDAPRPPVVVRLKNPPKSSGAPRRPLSAADLIALRQCAAGEITQTRCSVLMKASVPTVRRSLERLSEKRDPA